MQQSLDAVPLTTRATESLSEFERFSMIRFPLILLVVFLHNERGADFSSRLQDSPVAAGILNMFANGLGGIRMPTFFLISGYVFFRVVRPTATWFGSKMKSRVRSLLVPLILWNLLGLACLAIAQQFNFMTGFVSSKSVSGVPVLGFSIRHVLDAVFGLPGTQPFIYPLWFLRDLFLLVLLTPAIYVAIKASRGWFTLLVALGWAFQVKAYLVPSDALVFFVVGCHAAIAGRSLFSLDNLGPVAVVGWLMLQMAEMQQLLDPQAIKVKIALGVIAVLYASAWLARGAWSSRILGRAARYSFFIFVAHEPMLTFVRKVYFKALTPVTAPELLFAYFAVIGLVIAVLIAIFKCAERIAPRALSVMTGGRSSA